MEESSSVLISEQSSPASVLRRSIHPACFKEWHSVGQSWVTMRTRTGSGGPVKQRLPNRSILSCTVAVMF